MLPVRPVVAALRAPVVQRVTDTFAGENFGEAISRPAVLPLTRAGAEVNVTTCDLVIEPGIAGVRKIVNGVVEIKIVVTHPVHEVSQVVHAGHREAALDDVGMLEEGVRGVVRAERSAHRGRGNALRLAIVPYKRNDLFSQVGIENGLDVAAVKWMRALVVKAVSIDRIHGEEFDSSGVDEIRERADHALPLKLPLVAGASRETKERRPPMSLDHDPQLHTQPVRHPPVIFTFHPAPLCNCEDNSG